MAALKFSSSQSGTERPAARILASNKRKATIRKEHVISPDNREEATPLFDATAVISGSAIPATSVF